MSQQTSPRGTFLQIAEAVKTQIRSNPEMTQLPKLADLMEAHGVSRGVVLRAFGVLRKEGVAEPVPGGRWRVIGEGKQADRRPLANRIADVITDDGLKVGEAFPQCVRAVDTVRGITAHSGQGLGQAGDRRTSVRGRPREGADRPSPAEPRGAFTAVSTTSLTEWAYPLAESLLAKPLPRRWKHSLGVAERARTLAPILGADADLMEAAAVLHDIGYSPDLAKTGFHPLDGARHLRDTAHADERVVRLVAHHSCAWMEAEVRVLREELEAESQGALSSE